MVAYSFKARFAAPILAGTKRQTIRADRKRHARPGEELQLYTGMRTQHCKLIGRATCASLTPVSIHIPEGMVRIGERVLSRRDDLDLFAMSDGFRGWLDMREFWFDNHGEDEFHGVLITWGQLR